VKTLRRAVLLLLALVAPAHAQRTMVIERFDARITVNPDGSIDVVETISPRFSGTWNGIYRTIPIKYRTPQGFNWSVRIELQRVTDGSGQPLRTEASRERHYAKYQIWVPGAVNATRTVVLSYRVHNALRFFENHDELYWNVTGDEWEVPIEAATADIHLPAGAEAVRAIAFNGTYGSRTQDAAVGVAGTTVRIAMPRILQFREGMTAVVGWNPGLVARPTATDKVTGFLANNWPLAIPIPVFFAMFWLWRRRGRDPRPLPVAVRYEPPDGLSPAEAGTLLDNSADMRDITATVVDLAVRGHLRIEDVEVPRFFGLLKDEDYIFHRLDPPPGAPSPAPHEQEVLRGIFDGARSVKMSELANSFYKHLNGIRSAVFSRLIAKRAYRSRPDTVRTVWVFIGLLLGGMMAIGGATLAGIFLLTPVPFVVAGILVGLIVAGFGLFMPARTVAGARLLEQVLGFEEFLDRVESDRFERVVKTPEMFERCLPYAMAFGVEKKWARAFEDIYTVPPTWYTGTHVSGISSFNVASFSSRLSQMSSTAASTMSSSPRSSGGSGFSGGGSSGGGGGGGGGGGF